MTKSCRVLSLPLLLGVLPFAGAGGARGAEAPAQPKIVATVAGTPITQPEVEREVADALRQLDQRRQSMLAQALDAAINNRLLELEAEIGRAHV